MADATTSWAGCFGDKRLGKRGDLLFERMVAGCSCTLRRVGRGRAEELGFGRFLGNGKVTAEEILAAACRPLAKRVAGLHVLAIQDTTEVNYQRHAGRVRGLGPAGNGRDRGLFVHPVIAVAAAGGALLGLAGAQLWTRPEQRRDADYRKLAIEDKESHRWLIGAEQAKRALREAAHVTVIADRESDIYEEWARLPDARCDLITRASRDRALADGRRLFVAADGWPEAGRARVELRAQPGRAARTATLALRFGRVTIKRPKRCLDRQAPERLSLYLVDVREPAPAAGPGVDATVAEPVHWRLLTTHVVDRPEAAWRIVDWYRQRWHIEQLFRTLKRQGLDLEASQVCEAAALIKLAAMATVAAVRVMQLVLARDGTAERPASDVMAPPLMPLASALQRQLEGKTEAQKNPHRHGSLAWLAWIIARLGGWNGYKSERPPGPITMRRGWDRFEAISYGWILKQDV
jgi:hypothetical protein